MAGKPKFKQAIAELDKRGGVEVLQQELLSLYLVKSIDVINNLSPL